MHLKGEYVPSPSTWVREQIELYERTGGKEGNTLLDTGLPVIIVTMKGNKSGAIRKIALMKVEHEGAYALVASMGGAPKNPVWYNNLVANPQVEVRDGTVAQPMTAREVTGAEKAIWWERCVAAFPDYADYQARTARSIPVFVLTPDPA